MAKRAAQPPQDSFEDMHFPLAGIDLSMGFDKQTPRPVMGDYSRTTPIGQNVRGFDALAGRARGGLRPCLVRYINQQVQGTNPIQELNVVVWVS